jgi:hypothetical protein
MSLTPKLLIIHVAVGLTCLLLLWSVWQVDPGVSSEGRLMENLQACALFISLVLAIISFTVFRKTVPPYVSGGLAVLFLTLFLRELDVKNIELPEILVALGSGLGKRLLLGLLWMVAVLAAVNNRWRLKTDILACLRSPSGHYLLAGAVFYLAGDIMDKKLLPLARPVSLFWEEAFECLATLWCVMGVSPPSGASWAWWSGRWSTDVSLAPAATTAPMR